ncbi:hypothetical protein C8J57DRAFT_1248308 [Mycena rebaudengoi]|nr:hypothetical protein C8J57DRAFT_1248308 [Mycena rebaudengoi]
MLGRTQRMWEPHSVPRQCRNFRGADWEEFPDLLDTEIARKPLPPLPLHTPKDIDDYVNALTKRITTVLDHHVPLAHPSSYLRRWWNTGLSVLRRMYNAAHHAITKDNPADLSWEVMRTAKNLYHFVIRQARPQPQRFLLLLPHPQPHRTRWVHRDHTC